MTAAGRNIRSGIKEKYEKDNLGNFSAVFGDVLSVVASRNVLVRVTADFFEELGLVKLMNAIDNGSSVKSRTEIRCAAILRTENSRVFPPARWCRLKRKVEKLCK